MWRIVVDPHCFQEESGHGSSILCDQDPGFFYDQDLQSWAAERKSYYFLYIKTCNLLSLASMKDVKAIGKASIRQKKQSSTSKHEISSLFSFFVWVTFTLLYPDPADQNQCGSMRIQNHNTGWSESLLSVQHWTLYYISGTKDSLFTCCTVQYYSVQKTFIHGYEKTSN
jgi:hypothetical protein